MKVRDFIEKLDDDTHVVVRDLVSEIEGYLGDKREIINNAYGDCNVDRVFFDEERGVFDSVLVIRVEDEPVEDDI